MCVKPPRLWSATNALRRTAARAGARKLGRAICGNGFAQRYAFAFFTSAEGDWYCGESQDASGSTIASVERISFFADLVAVFFRTVFFTIIVRTATSVFKYDVSFLRSRKTHGKKDATTSGAEQVL